MGARQDEHSNEPGMSVTDIIVGVSWVMFFCGSGLNEPLNEKTPGPKYSTPTAAYVFCGTVGDRRPFVLGVLERGQPSLEE